MSREIEQDFVKVMQFIIIILCLVLLLKMV